MPRGTCETCGQHDVFLHASPLTFARNVLVCMRCLALAHAWDDDEDEEQAALDKDEDESNESEPRITPSTLLRLNFRL